VSRNVSDFGRLFRRSVAFSQEPIENYTSEALGIAIDHDDRPMRRALQSIVWHGLPPFDVDDVARVQARLQHHLSPTSGAPRTGYLDLVLDISLTNGQSVEAWVEAKIGTGEHGDQLDTYADHARERSPMPAIFCLSPTPLRAPADFPAGFDVGWLSWSSLVAAVEASPGSDGRWEDLLLFLEEERVAWRSLPAKFDTKALTRYLAVLRAVNVQVRDTWPDQGLDYPGVTPGLLTQIATKELDRSGRLTVTAGPMAYGLVPDGDAWRWWIAVGSVNYHKVALKSSDFVRQADALDLPVAWLRSGTRHAALEASHPLEDLRDHDAAVQWFRARLHELATYRILRPFLDGLAVKRRRGSDIPALADEPEDTLTMD
jgi:hypothetical protein